LEYIFCGGVEMDLAWYVNICGSSFSSCIEHVVKISYRKRRFT